MRRAVAVLLVLLGGCGNDPPAAPPAVAAKPLAVLIQKNAWLMVRGTDSPTFALYDDGRVIRMTKSAPHTVGTQWEEGHSEFASVVLEQAEREALVRTILGTDPDGFRALDARYGPQQGHVETTIHVWIEGKQRTVSVIGPRPRSPGDGAPWPSAFLTAFGAMTRFVHPGLKPWRPDHIEVMLNEFSHAKEPPVQWPKGWPGLDHPATLKFRDNYYWLRLDWSHRDELLALLRGLKQRFGEVVQPIEIGGRPWAVVGFRLPLPAEEQWMNK